MTLTRQSELFTKTRREAPSDEVSKNAQLLIRGGYVHKEMAGVYDLLPLGLRVVDKINGIIREEMNVIGGQEVFLSALQNPEIWKTTDRWTGDADEIWFKTQLKSGGELGLGFTHEEALTNLMREHISSYRDLPRAAYQIQTKFRNEARAKSGILRGREFLMKDLYSFCASKEQQDAFYRSAQVAYKNVFDRVGLGDRTYMTFASGGVFSKYSHEFQTLCETGEDTIYIDEEKKIGVNKEVLTDEVCADLGVKRDALVEKKAVEVGNIFSLGTRFSEGLGLLFTNEEGERVPVVMGSYGIGPTRVMGTIAEALSDDKGIVWPESVAPYQVHLISLDSATGGDVTKKAEGIARQLHEKEVDVLYDDRDVRAGEKFADADLLGIPLRVVVSEKSLAEGSVEVKQRAADEATLEPLDVFLARFV
ncbi:MAG TPA: aminoacyl--tRNA ligase-related protein [Candidatus Paceibacterota bacterium]|nr:aminoacyl--tRNA ligase-related protein [Candidatus Paceibacterota bacterium]